MLLKSIILSGLMAIGASGHIVRSPGLGNWCGAPKPSKAQLAVAQHFAAKEALARPADITERAAINVDTWFHVVATSTSVSDGYISVRHALIPIF
jgi:hypothetical protein